MLLFFLNSCCGSFVLWFLQTVVLLCCGSFMLWFFHVVFFHVVVFSCYGSFMFGFFHVVVLSRCGSFVLWLFRVEVLSCYGCFMSWLFYVVFLPCCGSFLMRVFHVLILLWWRSNRLYGSCFVICDLWGAQHSTLLCLVSRCQVVCFQPKKHLIYLESEHSRDFLHCLPMNIPFSYIISCVH